MDAELIAQHIPRLRRYALTLVRDRERADDLVQDTLERALRKFTLWRRSGDLRAWLFTIMHNIYVNQLRGMQSGLTISIDEESADFSVSQATREEVIEARDIISALNRLAPEFREILLLVGVEQLSYAEVAKVLGVPLGTVMSRLSRGREKLSALMAGESTPHLRRVK